MKPFKPLLLSVAALTLLAACTPTQNVRGNIVEDHQLAAVQSGDSQTDVLRKLGSPTTRAPFDDNVWYYLGQEKQKRGILDPEVINERIVVVMFDETGRVSEISDIDPQRLDVPFERRKTPTSGNDITALQQIFGNIGRFSSPAQ